MSALLYTAITYNQHDYTKCNVKKWIREIGKFFMPSDSPIIFCGGAFLARASQ